MAGFDIDFDKLKNIKLTKEQQQYVLLGVMVVFGGIYFYWNKVMLPLGKQAKELQVELDEKKSLFTTARNLKNNWEGYIQRRDDTQRAAHFVARRVPRHVGSIGMSIGLDKLFIENGIDMKNFAPVGEGEGAPADAVGFSKITAHVVADADYYKFGRLLSSLSEQEIIYNVEDVMIKPGDQRTMPGSITVNMKIVTYVDKGMAK